MTKKLYYRALLILEHLDVFIKRKESEFTLVPRLDKKDYKDHINQLMGFTKDYENEYKDVLKHEHMNKQKIGELNDKLLNHKDKTKMHKLLKEKEKKQFELAHNLMKETENVLQEKRKYTANALEELKEGIDDWLKEQKHAAQKELFLAILDLSLSVGKVALQPGGVFNFVNSIEKVFKSVEDVIKNINIENIKAFVNITNEEDIRKDLDIAQDINNKTDKIKEITRNLKSSHVMAGELNKTAEEMSKNFDILIIFQKALKLKIQKDSGYMKNGNQLGITLINYVNSSK
ncbi:hypothetical protein C2G38_990092 [Gigaspora rosea]|uniref:Uncharacterized protein n=1 Tax=Gigaspora rosea TaxID=44941 RepID=A0A397TYL8_9GLOM|nr:hypothetical protein C2G38_990092 [Gigaspora rosea]